MRTASMREPVHGESSAGRFPPPALVRKAGMGAFGSFLAELKRRDVYRVAVAYRRGRLATRAGRHPDAARFRNSALGPAAGGVDCVRRVSGCAAARLVLRAWPLGLAPRPRWGRLAGRARRPAPHGFRHPGVGRTVGCRDGGAVAHRGFWFAIRDGCDCHWRRQADRGIAIRKSVA